MNTYVVSATAAPMIAMDTPPVPWFLLARDGENLLKSETQSKLGPPVVSIDIHREDLDSAEAFQTAAEEATTALIEWMLRVLSQLQAVSPDSNRLFIWYQREPELKVGREGTSLHVVCDVAVCLTKSAEPPLPLGKHVRVPGFWKPEFVLTEIPAPDLEKGTARWSREITMALREVLIPPTPPPPEIGSL